MILSSEDLARQAQANREAALHRLEGAVGSDMAIMMFAMNVTLQTVRNLSGSGVLVKVAAGKWNLVESFHRWNVYREQQAGAIPSSTERFRQARASHIELKNAVLERSVIPIAEVESLWFRNASSFRETMVSFPSAAKRELDLSFDQEERLELLMDSKMLELQKLLEPEGGVPGGDKVQEIVREPALEPSETASQGEPVEEPQEPEEVIEAVIAGEKIEEHGVIETPCILEPEVEEPEVEAAACEASVSVLRRREAGQSLGARWGRLNR